MKNLTILFSLISLLFSNSVGINAINHTKHENVRITADDKILIKLSNFEKISRTAQVSSVTTLSVFVADELVFKSDYRFRDGTLHTIHVDQQNEGGQPQNKFRVKVKQFIPNLDEPIYSLEPLTFQGQSVEVNDQDQFKDIKVERDNADILETANVQIIHNSPYPVVDIYVDDAEALNDVPFRATTGMIQFPTSTTVGIAPANGDVIANFPFSLETNANYVVSASGILGNDATPFGLVASGLELTAVDTNHFGLKVFHGVTDAPAVDIYANGNLLVENLGYNEYEGYVQVPVGDYTIDVTAHGSDQSVASFAAPLSGFGGGTGIVFASGFLASQSDSSFSLILATPSGYSVSLPATPTALSTIADNVVSPSVFRLKQNYPNPFNPSTSIDFEVFESSKVSLNVYDLSGRLVKNLLSGNLNSGAYSIEWNGKNTNGISAAAGVYFYSISSGKSTIIKKMSLIK